MAQSITQTVRGIPAWWRESTTLWIALALGASATLAVLSSLRSRRGLALTAVRMTAEPRLGVSVISRPGGMSIWPRPPAAA